MLATLMTLALAAAAQTAPAQASADAPKRVECTKGPASKTLAALPWLVYGCSDNASVLLVAPKDNPVAPYNFILTKAGETYGVYGQGATSDQAAADSAATNLKAMTQDRFTALAREANAQK